MRMSPSIMFTTPAPIRGYDHFVTDILEGSEDLSTESATIERRVRSLIRYIGDFQELFR